jgi:hypothetical protein
MSFFDINNPNNVQFRLDSLKADDIYQKNHTTGEYERVGAGDGPPIALPYYLKQNSIDIDEGTNGTELTATNLTFGDASGNISIDKSKAKILSDIKTDIIDSALIPNHGNGDIVFVGYDQVSKKLIRSPSMIKLNNDIFCNYSGITLNGAYYQSYRFGCANGLNTIQGYASSNAANCAFSINLNGAIYILNYEDIQVTNKLKTIAEKVTDANSKMLIYDATTKAFNYTELPSGGSATLPAYLGPNSILMNSPQYIQMNSNSYLRSLSSTGYDATLNNAKLQIVNAFPVTGEYVNTTYDIGKITMTDEFSTSVFTKKRLDQLGQTTQWLASDYENWNAVNPESIDNVYNKLSGYTGYLYSFKELAKNGDILYIDLSQWALEMSTVTGARGFVITCDAFDWDENPTFEVVYSGTNTVTHRIIDVTDTNVEKSRSLFVEFAASSNILDGVVRIKCTSVSKSIPSGTEIATVTMAPT